MTNLMKTLNQGSEFFFVNTVRLNFYNINEIAWFCVTSQKPGALT